MIGIAPSCNRLSMYCATYSSASELVPVMATCLAPLRTALCSTPDTSTRSRLPCTWCGSASNDFLSPAAGLIMSFLPSFQPIACAPTWSADPRLVQHELTENLDVFIATQREFIVAKRRVSLLTRAGDVSGSRGRRCGRGGVPAVGGSQIRRAPVTLLPTYLSSSRIRRTLLAGFLFL